MKNGRTRRTGLGLLLLACGVGMLAAEEPVRVEKEGEAAKPPAATTSDKESPRKRKGRRDCKDPWIGIHVSKPDPAVHAQLKNIPRGVGFVVDRVAEGSPAEAAGLREYDFIWKMNDQLLVNLSQFLTLLNLQEEGGRMTLTLQRVGVNEEVTLTVGQRPEDEKGRDSADSKVMGPAIPGLPTQIVNVLHKVAEIRDENGVVRIWRDGEGFGWAEFDKFGLEMRSGTLAEGGEEAFPPDLDETLKDKLQALIRGYEQAERSRDSGGGPRVRRAPEDRG